MTTIRTPNLDSPPEDLVTDNLVGKIKRVSYKSNKPERAFRKHELGVSKEDFSLFTEPIIEIITKEDAEKTSDFMDYLQVLSKYCPPCMNCGNKKFHIKDTRKGGELEIVIQCPTCKCIASTDNTFESKNYIKWFNNILTDYPDVDITNGFPKLLRYKYMGKCYECPGIPVHDKEMIKFFSFQK